MNFFLRTALVATMVAVSASSVTAAELSKDQSTALAALTNRYVQAVVAGDADGVLAATTPDFVYTSSSGKTFTAPDLAANSAIVNLTFGRTIASSHVESAMLDGAKVTSTMSQHVAGESMQQEPPLMVSVDSRHRLTLVSTAGSWKIASDVELSRSSTQ